MASHPHAGDPVFDLHVGGKMEILSTAALTGPDELSLAYALTIHKSQGSEYPAVIIPLHSQHYMLLQRNLLYTGITRGKKLVVLVGSRKALRLAAGRHDTARRCTTLAVRLS